MQAMHWQRVDHAARAREKEAFAAERGSCAHNAPRRRTANDQGPGCDPGERLPLRGM